MQNFQTYKRKNEFILKDFRDNAYSSFENIKKEIEIKMKPEKSILDKDYKKLITSYKQNIYEPMLNSTIPLL